MLTATEHIRMAQDIIVNGEEPLLPPIHPMYVTDPMTGKCPRRQELSNQLNAIAHICEHHEKEVGCMEEGDDDVEIATPISGSALDEVRVVAEHLRSACQIISADESNAKAWLVFQLEVHDTALGATEIYMRGDNAVRTSMSDIIDSVREQEAKNPGGVLPRVIFDSPADSPTFRYKIINADFDDPLKRFVAMYRGLTDAEV